MRNEPGGDLVGMDDQDCLKKAIKYDGHQVASVELESMRLGYPAVANAAVIAGPDDGIVRRVLVERDRTLIAGVR